MRRGLPAIALSLLLVGLASTFSFADEPPGTVFIPYQGFLENEGVPVTEPVAMAFKLYDAESGGALLHTSNLVITPANGSFAVQIGPVDATLLSSPELHLGLEVEGVPLAGRQRIRSSPYAVRGKVGEPFVADSVVTDAVVAGAVSADTLSVLGNARVNQLVLGDMGHAQWAGLRHQSLTADNSFALQQRDNGSVTRLNAAPAGRVSLSVGNVEHVSVSASGTLETNGDVDIGGDLQVGDVAAAGITATGISAGGQRVITGITTCRGEGCGCPAGFSRHHQDLNQGAGGNYIFLCIRTSPAP